MTNKQAQITINAIKLLLDNAQYSDDVEEALNMAISALEIQTNAEEVTSPLLTEKWKSKHRRTES